MNKIKNNLNNDFWDWLDYISIKYKNYEIKNAIIAHKYGQLFNLMYSINVNHFNLRKILSSVKWKLILHLFINRIPKRNKNLLIKKNYDSLYDLSNKNLYAINFSPTDQRNFLHIAPLVKRDDHSLVITIRHDVYNYFNKIKIPVILLDISIPWRNENDLKIQVSLNSSKKNLFLSVDLYSLSLLSRAASLIDLLDIVINENGLPRVLITLQDFYYFDSVFATYFLGKIPTVTLQHGLIGAKNFLWKYLISDKIIVWGIRQAEILESLGVNSKKIEVLGTAKYDLYLDKIDNELENNKSKRVLLGIQQTMFFKENDKIIFDFIRKLLSSKEDYTISIRFHPAIIMKDRKIFLQKLKKLNLDYGVNINISYIKNPLEDISESNIVLVSYSGLAMEAMLLKKPVIEILLKKEDSIKFGDYRDFSLHAFEGEEATKLIIKLLKDVNFYKEIIKKQNNFINSEIMPPPAIPRILNFINSLNNDKRSVKSNQ